ncbi:hypothetical protein OG474_18365 [Kribbella sp. NBC_01505]|uniref:hypothetical protein n=1 Tax=Kribbella sp. NBC_01505 TaxID=2903580 RepID=UPI00386DB39E
MPRPSDWNAIGLDKDPTPGEPEQFADLPKVLTELGDKARKIFEAIEKVMNKNDDSAFVGEAADALRGKVDGKLRDHIGSVANAFQTAGQVVGEWHTALVEQQRKADGALAAGRNLNADDPERDRQKGIAEEAGREQARLGTEYSKRISSLDISLPKTNCELFWEAFKILAILLIVPALVFGGVVALIAIGVNLALFIKAAIDFVKGDASFLDLFLAGLGLIAPTTRGLPILSLVKGGITGITAAGKGVFNGLKILFSGPSLFRAGAWLGGKLSLIGNLSLRGSGLFVIDGIKWVLKAGPGALLADFGKFSLKAIDATIGAVGTGLAAVGNGIARFWGGTKEFLGAHFGGLQWTRIILPVAADEIRAFKAAGLTNLEAFAQALKVGVVGRGVFSQHLTGIPVVAAAGRGISTSVDATIGVGLGKGFWTQAKDDFIQHMFNPLEVKPVDGIQINRFGIDTGSGFFAGRMGESLHEIRISPPSTSSVGNGFSGHSTPGVSSLDLPATSGVQGTAALNIPAPHAIPAPHTGQPSAIPTQAGVPGHNAVSPTAPAPMSVGDLVANGLRGNSPVLAPNFTGALHDGIAHGFAANLLNHSIDDILRTSAVTTPVPHAGFSQALQTSMPSSFDRVNSALNLLHGEPGMTHFQPPALAKTDVPAPPRGVGSDIPSPANAGFSPGRSEIPLTGLPGHPDALVKVERFEGGIAMFNLHGGGPNARLDPLDSGGVRITDTGTGRTTRVDNAGQMIDTGIRLTKADGLPRIDDRVLIEGPNGTVRVTDLEGNLVPGVTAHRSDGGQVEITGNDRVAVKYDSHGRLAPRTTAVDWSRDHAAQAGVFRQAGDTEATGKVKMEEFAVEVRPAQQRVAAAQQKVDIDGQRIDGPSTGPAVGDKAYQDLRSANDELSRVKASYEGKYGVSVDSIQRQLDDVVSKSLKERPRLLGGVGSPPPLRTEHFPLSGGAFDGRRVTTTYDGNGNFAGTSVDDGFGGRLPVAEEDDLFVVPSSQGPLHYERSGQFVGEGPSLVAGRPRPEAPPGLTGADLASWQNHVDLARTHLAARGELEGVSDMMLFVSEGGFTSQRGFGGFIDEAALRGGENLVGRVEDFNEIAENLMTHGPVGPTTVYRGMAMDPAGAAVPQFIERLPFSTSNNWKTQLDLLQGADPAKRVVLEIEVPPGHGKMSMAYPEGYRRAGEDAVAWNQAQFEMTVSPSVLTPTGRPVYVKDGLTVVPVRAEQIPAAQIGGYLQERWPGIASAEAFDDFAKALETEKLSKFWGMSDVTATSKLSPDGRTIEITVRKPGFGGQDMVIKVIRNQQADSVQVKVTADGRTTEVGAWSKDGFQPIAIDLRAGTLHQNDVFKLRQPAGWLGGEQPFHQQWADDLAAKKDVFRQPGDTPRMVDDRLEDFSRLQQAQAGLDKAHGDFGLDGHRIDGPSSGVPVGQQSKIDLESARADLDASKVRFERKHGIDPDDLGDVVGQLGKRPKLDGGASRLQDVPGADVSFQVVGSSVHFAGSRADSFTGSVLGQEVTVTRWGADGASTGSWTFARGNERFNLQSQSVHLTDGPLAGEVLTVQGIGRMDGTLVQDGITRLTRLTGDDLTITGPQGVLRYDRGGAFQGADPGVAGHLGSPVPPPHLAGDELARWHAQADLSRIQLTRAAGDDLVRGMMNDVKAGTFSSRRGDGGFVNPSQLADGRLLGSVERFVKITDDLLFDGPDNAITVYRGLSMDPESAKADVFTDVVPSSASTNLGFQTEWAAHGAASNRFILEIDVPPGHGKLALSYPEGYRANAGEAPAVNPGQSEVTLAPAVYRRTGPDRIQNGLTIIPVRAERIPIDQLPDLLHRTPPGMPIETAYDGFVKAFDQNSIIRWEDFEDVQVSTATGADGNSTTMTVTKPGAADPLMINISKDPAAGTVSVKLDGGGYEVFEETWKSLELKGLAADLRGNVLHNNVVFEVIPRPLSWDDITVGAVTLPAVRQDPLSGDFGGRMLNRPEGGQPHVTGPDAEKFRVEDFGDDGFRVTGPDGRSQLYDGSGELAGEGRALFGHDDLFDTRFTSSDGAGGIRAVDERGVPIPGTDTRLLANGRFQIAEPDGVVRSFDAAGGYLDQRIVLGGLNDGRVLVHEAGGGLRWQDPVSSPGVAGQAVPEHVPGGGYRVVEPNTVVRNFDAAGSYLSREITLRGSGGGRVLVQDADGVLRWQDPAVVGSVPEQVPGGYRLIEPDGVVRSFDAAGGYLDQRILLGGLNDGRVLVHEAGGGLRWQDPVSSPGVAGQAVPEHVPGGGYRVVEPNTVVRNFDAAGSYLSREITLRGSGGGRVLVQDADGVLRLHDPVIPGGSRERAVPAAVDGGGFRITEPNTVVRNFDAAGGYLDQRIALGGVDGRILVHEAGGRLRWQDPATTTALPEPIPGGYRDGGVDGAAYRTYDGAGTVRANGHPVGLPGQNGYLEIAANGGAARRLDPNFQSIEGRQVRIDQDAGEVTVGRAGGFDVFGLNGAVLREVTDLDGYALATVGGRVTRDPNGNVSWTAVDGSPLTTPYRAQIAGDGSIRIELNVQSSVRNGEYHVFSDGRLVEQGFPVVRNGRPTEFTYVVDRVRNVWTRTDGTNLGTGGFHHGSVDVAGLGNGQIRLKSSTGGKVDVFERRWLPDGTILDSFRRTDTLGFGWFDRRTTWVTTDTDGALANHGTRHFDTSTGWHDVDASHRTVRDYRSGLQKYNNGAGHVLAIKQADGSWIWHRYDDHAGLVAQGNRTLERIGDGWTDTVIRAGGTGTDIAQQKWGAWHLPETAGQYREFTITRGVDGQWTRSATWLQQARQGPQTGSLTQVGDDLLQVVRRGEQRPPVLVRESPLFRDPRPHGAAAHLAGDSRVQVQVWSQGDRAGLRYVAPNPGAHTFDVDAGGNFVRSTTTLADGTKLKVGDHARPPEQPHLSGGLPWEAGAQRGWRIGEGLNWQDVRWVDGEWVVVREGRPGGVVREFPDPAVRTVWTDRDAHGNLVGLSSRSIDRPDMFVEATGPAFSSRWTWREVDANGAELGAGGQREFFRGSWDDRLSWDESFRDFDAARNLVRDRRMLDGGRYVESWSTPDGWRSVAFDKFGNRATGSVELERLWSTKQGDWQRDWSPGAVYSRDQLPLLDGRAPQVVRETPKHIEGGVVRIREYHLGENGTDLRQWKEFDRGAIVRERKLVGDNYLETTWRGQWKLWHADGDLVAERGQNGLVFEMHNGRLRLTGDEHDFRGPLTEIRGWGRRVREAQRIPWLGHSDWAPGGTSIAPVGQAGYREARYAPTWQLVAAKMALEFGQEFVLQFGAYLTVYGIIAAGQHRPFTGEDALKALMNAATGATIKVGVGAALTESRLLGLKDLRFGMNNLDRGQPFTARPFNPDRHWSNEWAGNEFALRWRSGAIFDYGVNVGLAVLGGFVNGAMNAAIFGIVNESGQKVKLTGWDAIGEGAIGALASFTSGVSTALLRNLATGIGGSRILHRQGFGEFWQAIPFRIFEGSMQGMFLTNAYRVSISPSWYQSGGSGDPAPGTVKVPAAGLWLPPGSLGAQ